MRNQSFSYVLTNALFKLVPTVLITLYLWLISAKSTSSFHVDYELFIVLFTAGLVVSFFLYSYNIRFSVSFLLVLIGTALIYRYIQAQPSGEFDVFYLTISFYVYAAGFLAAWLIGFGFARISIFPWIAAVLFFGFGVSYIVSDFLELTNLLDPGLTSMVADMVATNNPLLHRGIVLLFFLFIPVLFYSIYIVFVNEILRKYDGVESDRLTYLLRRSVGLIATLIGILLIPLLIAMFWPIGDYQEILAQSVSGSADFLKKEENPQTNQTEFDLNDYAQLLPEVKLSDETVFCTYIDNFFPLKDGGRVPIPVHFRRFVLNRYEPETEKFVLDPYPPSAIPSDLFSPSTRDVPIGFYRYDSTIHFNTAKYEYRRDISSLVYIQSLSPDAYVAPNAGYSYQKLPVPPEDKETFHSAYEANSIISIWNLPPFMFSTTNPELASFKEQRAQALRKDGYNAYARLDTTFMAYYTQRDTTDSLIQHLADSLVAGATSPYDRVERIIDYFLGKKEDGTPRFTYTLEPGVPRDPDQSFMHYFLVENKRGYCTYFAGATTLLLRAAGIPTRMTVGYAIVDRSNKNTGWYWVYADQGHAWLEVYFPSFGWVDFDTTPSDDTEVTRPPKPDATPPDFARSPFFAMLGKVDSLTADSSGFYVKPYEIRFRDAAEQIPDSLAEQLVIMPRGAVVKVNDHEVAVRDLRRDQEMVMSGYSFNPKLDNIRNYDGKTPFMKWVKKQFPDEIPVDEAFIVYIEKPEEEGTIFVVDGEIESILPDSSGLTIMPRNIRYRNKNYAVDPLKFGTIRVRPADSTVYVDGDKVRLSALDRPDSLTVVAESGNATLHSLKPYLATESFRSWYRNSFPENVPVDRIDIELPKMPLGRRLASGLFIALLGGIFGLLIFPSVTYGLLNLMARVSRKRKQLYWVYRLSLMMLNQLGHGRAVQTPMEYATETIDPKFGTEFGKLMNIYLRMKYSPAELSNAEAEFVENYPAQLKSRVYERFTWGDRIKSFLNFVRTARFLSR